MKRAARAIAGFFAGYILVVILSTLTTGLLRHVWPELGTGGQGPTLEILDFLYATVYAGLAGYLAHRIGGAAAAYALAAVFVILALATAALGLDVDHSPVYQWLMVVAAGAAVLVGGRVAARRDVVPA